MGKPDRRMPSDAMDSRLDVPLVPLAEREQASAVRSRPPPGRDRATELEARLAEALASLTRHQHESEEDSAAYGQSIARLAHSERTLGQTKAKLLQQEERAEQAEARASALNARLAELEATREAERVARERGFREELASAIRAEQARAAKDLDLMEAELARRQEVARARDLEQMTILGAQLEVMNQQLKAKTQELEAKTWELETKSQELEAKVWELGIAEERNATWLARQTSPPVAPAAGEPDAVSSLRQQLAEREGSLATARREVSELHAALGRVRRALEVLEGLGREVFQVSFRAAAQASEVMEGLTESAPAREEDRVTVKPTAQAGERHAPRVVSSPDIEIDGMKLEG